MSDPFFITEPTVISFSGGRTSAYMLWRVLQAHGGKLPDEAIVCFANTGAEHPATLDFVKACEDAWGVKIHWLEYRSSGDKFVEVAYATASRNYEPFTQLINSRKYLPNPVARFCTGEMKVLTIERFMKSKGCAADEFETMVGIRKDEERRVAKLRGKKLCPLVSANVTQHEVQQFWKSQPFDLSLDFVGGMTPLGNCQLCFLKGTNHIHAIIKDDPTKAIWWAEQEKKIGGTFRKDRPTYQQFLNFEVDQDPLFTDETIGCFCGD